MLQRKTLLLTASATIFGIGILFIFLNIINTYNQSLESFISQEEVQNIHVIHFELIDDKKAIALLETAKGVNINQYQRSSLVGWKLSSSSQHIVDTTNKSMTWAWSSIGTKDQGYPIYYGYVLSPEIVYITIGEDYHGTIVDLQGGNKLWFLIGHDTTGTEEIKGLSKQAEVLFSRYSSIH